MAKVLLLNPSRWGRGITPIWIPSHAAVLKARGHEVRLFDCTFYKGWMVDEVGYNTENRQYKPSDYARRIRYEARDVVESLSEFVGAFRPDVIFWSGLSSHLHGEGEYVNIQYGHHLVERVRTTAVRVAGGLQPTARPLDMPARFPAVDVFIRGESEFALAEVAGRPDGVRALSGVRGLVFKRDGEVMVTPRQDLIRELDSIPPYDYSLFDDQVFLRPYNGTVLRAVDYEMSRGCPFSCTYCVESVVQGYYGFDENRSGVLSRAPDYLRSKSAARIFSELEGLARGFSIDLVRCQDANFLTIDRGVLRELAERVEGSGLNFRLYVETRPEGIDPGTVALLKRLKVDGVGMGVEVSTESFRRSSLNRYASQERIVAAFSLLREAGIKRTAYNVIGLPGQSEDMIRETVEFNRRLDPDNMTVAFYSPYLGTREQAKGRDMNYFDDYERDVDGQLRTVASGSALVGRDLLMFYKRFFVELARSGPGRVDELKRERGIS